MKDLMIRRPSKRLIRQIHECLTVERQHAQQKARQEVSGSPAYLRHDGTAA